MKITVHERKSEDFNYGRVSTPVAQAYKVLDNQYCDERTGKITGPAFDAIMVMAENDRPICDYAQNKRTKSHSVAWMALLKDIAYTLQWHDDTLHANSLTSEQLKNWFRLKGQDYKEELAPLVKLVDEWRADMFKDESKQAEALEDIWRGAEVLTRNEACEQIDYIPEIEKDIIDEYGEDYGENPDAIEEYMQRINDYVDSCFDQDYVSIDGEEIPLGLSRDPKLLIVLTDDTKHGDEAVELVKKLANGELTGHSTDGDYVAIVEGVHGSPHFDIYSE